MRVGRAARDIWRAGGGPRILGHRGASAHQVENTLEALLAARATGADGVELDVRAAADGALVVFHDADLARLAGRAERVSRMSLARLREVRLRRDGRISTLDEVLGALDGECLVNIEIKAERPGGARQVADGVVAAVERHRPHRDPARVIVSSFDPLTLARVRRRAPRLATGYLFHARQVRPLARAWPAALLQPTALHPDKSLATPENVAAWHRRGLAVNVWTVDDPPTIRRLAALGVDAIITNDPAAARAALTR